MVMGPSPKIFKRNPSPKLFWFKGDEGADLFFVNRLDFTRGAKLVAAVTIMGQQIGRHLGPVYQVVCITFPHPPPAPMVRQHPRRGAGTVIPGLRAPAPAP